MRVAAVKPYFSEEDIQFITSEFQKILRGESFLSMYKHSEEFEKKFAAMVGTQYGVGCNSGTSALELICRALGVEGKEVILPSNTFIATANAIINAGGTPVFADCTENMSLDSASVAEKITDKTAAIFQVHIGGIISKHTLENKKLAQEHGIHLLEDAAQAHGSSLNGMQAGSFGTAAGFSFFSTKVMTTGEGGMVTTNEKELVEKMISMREFGKVKTGIYINYHKHMGYNWRMPEVSALLGLRQLQSLPQFIKRRQEIAKLYDEQLSGRDDIVIVEPDDKAHHNYFKYTVLLPKHDRAEIHKKLAEKGVQLSGYIYELPLHKQPVFPDHNNISLPTTERVCAQHICLPIYYELTDEEVMYVCNTLKEVLA